MIPRITCAVLIALLTACNSTNGALSSPGLPPADRGGARSDASGIDSDFVVHGRYIDESLTLLGSPVRPGAGVPFYVKGLDYAPTPIDTVFGEPPGLNSPLRDGNSAIWMRDLPKMRALGANAIHVYNVAPPGYDEKAGPITNFLNKAWNGGRNPIYVLMSIQFDGKALLNKDAVASLAKQYHDLDQKYAKDPAVLGTAISNEIGATNFLGDPKWWDGFNTVAKAAKQGFADGGDANKIITTSEPDGNIGAIVAGEANRAAVDVWGINIYRGRTFTGLFEELRRNTKKPVILTEYGATAAYHPAWSNKYYWKNGFYQLGYCAPKDKTGPDNRDVKELPKGGDPGMAGLVDYVWNNDRWLISAFNDEGGLISGGFYFEWTDEWYKAGDQYKSVHTGNDAFNGHYPGCSEDQAWYGLNSVSKGTGYLDVLTPRPTLAQLKTDWKGAP